MSELVLHHFLSSPFSEKVRLILGAKKLGWKSVLIPPIMPKPDVVALTGGYRKTPILQVGADIYCDTELIGRFLESQQPKPTLYPADQPLAPIVAQWADSTLFWTCIPYTRQPAGIAALMPGATPEQIKTFAADRAAFTVGMQRKSPADASAQLNGYLASLDAQLSDGRSHLLGDAASIADFAVAHCLWFIRRAPALAGPIAARPALTGWLDRILAGGHGEFEQIDSGAALQIARSQRSHASARVEPGLGFDAQADVAVAATDYGMDAVIGKLVGLSNDEVVIERSDPRAGTVHVHFPRAGFGLRAAESAQV